MGLPATAAGQNRAASSGQGFGSRSLPSPSGSSVKPVSQRFAPTSTARTSPIRPNRGFAPSVPTRGRLPTATGQPYTAPTKSTAGAPKARLSPLQEARQLAQPKAPTATPVQPMQPLRAPSIPKPIASGAPSTLDKALPAAGRALSPLGRSLAQNAGPIAFGVGTAQEVAKLPGYLRDLGREAREFADWAKSGFNPNWRGIPIDDPNYDQKAEQRDAGQSLDPRFDPKGKPNTPPIYPEGQMFGAVGKRYNVRFFYSYLLPSFPSAGRQRQVGILSEVFGPISNAPVRPFGDGGRTVGLYYASRSDGTGQTYYPISSADRLSDLQGGVESLEPIGDAPPAPGVISPPPGSEFDFSPDRVIVPGLNDDDANQGADEGLGAGGLPQTGYTPKPLPDLLGKPFPTPTQSPNPTQPAPQLQPDPIPSPLLPTEPLPDPGPLPTLSPGDSPLPGSGPLPGTGDSPLPSPGQKTLPGTSPGQGPVTNVTIDGQPVDDPPTAPPPSSPGKSINKKTGTLNPPLNPVPPVTPPTPGGCADPCIQGISDKLKDLADKFKTDPEITIKIFRGCADDGAIEFEEQILTVPEAEADAYQILYDRIFALESQKCNPCHAVAAVPDWWAARLGSDRPQAVLTYANVVNGKRGRSRWTVSIPHYNLATKGNLNFPTYIKGSCFARLTLLDNSKLIVNGQTEQIAEDTVRQLIPFISPELLPLDSNYDIHIGQRRGQALSEAIVMPVSISYFSSGQRNMTPDWVIDL